MASLGHIAVGMAAARLVERGRTPGASSMAFWSALSLLPDADVVGFALGVEYGDPWGHRGATHSLTLAIALGVAIGAAAARFDRPARRIAVLAAAVLASHALVASGAVVRAHDTAACRAAASQRASPPPTPHGSSERRSNPAGSTPGVRATGRIDSGSSVSRGPE